MRPRPCRIVSDENGVALSNVPVQFSRISNIGSISNDIVYTDDVGIATVIFSLSSIEISNLFENSNTTESVTLEAYVNESHNLEHIKAYDLITENQAFLDLINSIDELNLFYNDNEFPLINETDASFDDEWTVQVKTEDNVGIEGIPVEFSLTTARRTSQP